jgi:hypothetical protein
LLNAWLSKVSLAPSSPLNPFLFSTNTRAIG